MRRARIKVYGRVQGVFFRRATWEKAQELGVRGYVKNLLDGSVEVMAFQSKEVLDEFINFCRSNPGHSRVEDLEVEFGEGEQELNCFEIL